MLEDIAGLIPNELGEALADLAEAVPADQAIVEIGSFKGKSTCYLAVGAELGGGAHVYAVDPWDTPGNVTGRFGFAEASTREAFHDQVAAAGHADHVTAIQGFSVEVAATWPKRRKIGLLYIDGDHSGAAVYADFEAWRPYLAKNATVAFDDFDTPRNPGVRMAIERLGLDVEIIAERLAVCQP